MSDKTLNLIKDSEARWVDLLIHRHKGQGTACFYSHW